MSRPELTATVVPGFSQNPNEVAESHAVVRALAERLSGAGVTPSIEGLSCWTDAALFTEAGIPAVCFGPGDIAVAHAAEEYVPVREVEIATDVLDALLRRWFAGGSLRDA